MCFLIAFTRYLFNCIVVYFISESWKTDRNETTNMKIKLLKFMVTPKIWSPFFQIFLGTNNNVYVHMCDAEKWKGVELPADLCAAVLTSGTSPSRICREGRGLFPAPQLFTSSWVWEGQASTGIPSCQVFQRK